MAVVLFSVSFKKSLSRVADPFLFLELGKGLAHLRRVFCSGLHQKQGGY